MKIKIKETFVQDWITREAGEKLRLLVSDALHKAQNIELDFSDCLIASTSFFDESIAKLALEKVTSEQIQKHLKILHLHPRDKELLLDLCQRRGVRLGFA